MAQKQAILTYFFLALVSSVFGQNVSINEAGDPPNPFAVIDIDATNNNKGILIPRLTSAERTSIAALGTSEEGLMVYDETTQSFWFWTGHIWAEIESGAMKLRDSDADTEVKVEESPDEDIIRFYLIDAMTEVEQFINPMFVRVDEYRKFPVIFG